MKIVIAHFSTSWVNMSGGVEKTCCALASAMVKRGHDVTVLYIDALEGAPYFPLDPRVKTENLFFENGKQVISDKLPLKYRICREMLRPFSKSAARAVNAVFKGRQYGEKIQKWFHTHEADVVLSVSPMSAKYLLIDGECRVPVIEMTREDPAAGFPNLSKQEKQAVRMAKMMQVLLPEDLDTAQTFFPDMPTTVIGNAIAPAAVLARPGEEKCRCTIVNVGSLGGRKNQKLLVEAFEGLAEDYPQWDVELWGEKDSYYGRALAAYIDRKHLAGRVRLMGITKDIGVVYAAGDIFAYPSESEGFPNGVIEAMAAGLPVIGLKMCHGTNYLVQDGKTGLLADNTVDSFREALKTLMDNAALRGKMGKAGLAATASYAPEKIWDQWEILLQQACGKFEKEKEHVKNDEQ